MALYFKLEPEWEDGEWLGQAVCSEKQFTRVEAFKLADKLEWTEKNQTPKKHAKTFWAMTVILKKFSINFEMKKVAKISWRNSKSKALRSQRVVEKELRNY